GFECRLDGGPWAACTSPDAPSGLADGSHTFEARSTDLAGNVDPTPASFTWVVDTTAPDTSITAGPPSQTASATATVSFWGDDGSGAGVAGFECRLDGGPWAACASPADMTGLADGSHTFDVRDADQAGNVDTTPASMTWTVDTTPPGTSIDSAPSGSTTSTS